MEQIASYQRKDNPHRTDPGDFLSVLNSLGIRYTEEGMWLRTGWYEIPQEYVFFLPVRISQARKLLSVIMPVLAKEREVSCLVVKDETEMVRMNSGYYGLHMPGKGIQVWMSSGKTAAKLAPELLALTVNFHGMRLPDCVCLENVLYVSHVIKDRSLLRKTREFFYNPYRFFKTVNSLPDKIIVGKWFLPVKIIKSSGLGNTYKGINLLEMKWCLLQQANIHAADDLQGRDIRDRLLWQRAVMERLEKVVRVPKIIGYAEYGAFSFMVTEFIEGENLMKQTKKLLHPKGWIGTGRKERILLMRYYLEVLEIVERIHREGFIHRNVQPSSFMVSLNGKLVAIGLGFAWPYSNSEGCEPFFSGAKGYASPEQQQGNMPEVSHDVYSLGALFYYLVTGRDLPGYAADGMPKEVTDQLRLHQVDELLIPRIARCLSARSEERPSLEKLKMLIIHVLHDMIFRNGE
ncbi:MAG: protein kinase [Pseudosphingobacterium sp.]|nr:protein kinase [Pseudosphingobacterium sp.]